MSRASGIVASSLVLVAGGGAWLWWHRQRLPLATSAAPVQLAAPAVGSATQPPPATPAIHYPVPVESSHPPPTPRSFEDADAQVKTALVDLLGRRAVRSFLRLDGFVRRLVATVDNLATDNAAAQTWPVSATAGHLETEVRDGSAVISERNADRYAPLVHLVELVDTQRAVALYFRLYPLLQRGYEELGYPGRYFNDRVVEVIDNLLATPAVSGPLKVERLPAEGAALPGTAGIYIFADPNLENCTAGQKILLRMGRENASIIVSKLSDVRRRLVAREAARTASGR